MYIIKLVQHNLRTRQNSTQQTMYRIFICFVKKNSYRIIDIHVHIDGHVSKPAMCILAVIEESQKRP